MDVFFHIIAWQVRCRWCTWYSEVPMQPPTPTLKILFICVFISFICVWSILKSSPLSLKENEKYSLILITSWQSTRLRLVSPIHNIKHNFKTSRDRPKSAPYPRLKNSKKTSKCQVFSSTVPAWGKILKNPNFFELFWSPVSRIVPKNCKRGPLGGFEHPFLCKIEKKWRVDPLETLKKLRKKSHKAEKTCTKKFDQGRDSNPRPSAWQTSKSLINLYAKCQQW